MDVAKSEMNDHLSTEEVAPHWPSAAGSKYLPGSVFDRATEGIRTYKTGRFSKNSEARNARCRRHRYHHRV